MKSPRKVCCGPESKAARVHWTILRPYADVNRANPLEELNEEDQQLKNELEMLVERLKVWFFNPGFRYAER